MSAYSVEIVIEPTRFNAGAGGFPSLQIGLFPPVLPKTFTSAKWEISQDNVKAITDFDFDSIDSAEDWLKVFIKSKTNGGYSGNGLRESCLQKMDGMTLQVWGCRNRMTASDPRGL